MAVIVGVVSGGLVVVGGAVTEEVVVVEATDGTELLSVPVDDDDTVVLAYTHSVEKTPVRDIYTVRDGELVMTRMEFSSFGAGLPADADVDRTDDGRFSYEPTSPREGDLLVATGTIAGHELIVEGERYDLVELADAGSVRITVTTRLRI
ncbi:MAG: DUF1850 domain-containing protein [Halobacteriota archaeon]